MSGIFGQDNQTPSPSTGQRAVVWNSRQPESLICWQQRVKVPSSSTAPPLVNISCTQTQDQVYWTFITSTPDCIEGKHVTMKGSDKESQGPPALSNVTLTEFMCSCESTSLSSVPSPMQWHRSSAQLIKQTVRKQMFSADFTGSNFM